MLAWQIRPIGPVFLFAEIPQRLIPESEWYPLGEFGYELLKQGMFPLPYERFVFEVSYRSGIATNGQFVPKRSCVYQFERNQDGDLNVEEFLCLEHAPPTWLASYGVNLQRATIYVKAFDRTLGAINGDGGENIRGRPATVLMIGCVALISRDVDMQHVPAPPKLNSKRKKHGRLPLVSYNIVKIGGRVVGDTARTGTHASPRLHFRRGHLRRLPDGRRVIVAPCLVGSAERGLVLSDYQVAAP